MHLHLYCCNKETHGVISKIVPLYYLLCIIVGSLIYAYFIWVSQGLYSGTTQGTDHSRNCSQNTLHRIQRWLPLSQTVFQQHPKGFALSQSFLQHVCTDNNYPKVNNNIHIIPEAMTWKKPIKKIIITSLDRRCNLWVQRRSRNT